MVLAVSHEGPLRVLGWNLGHKTREVAIPASFYTAVDRLAPSVLVLNEFKDGQSRSELRRQLARQGFNCFLASQDRPRHNQVLIASKGALEAGDLMCPGTPDQHASTNFLHVRHVPSGIEIVGLRAPAYRKRAETEAYWRALDPIVSGSANRPIFFIGDFNVDPAACLPPAKTLFSSLVQAGWHLPVAAGPWSYVSGTRIDHVLSSGPVEVSRCEYVKEIGDLVLASAGPSRGISDHAALLVELTVSDPVSLTGQGIRGRGQEPPSASRSEAALLASEPPGAARVSYASRGSQRWLQIAVNETPGLIQSALAEAGALQQGEEVEWKSPKVETNFEEYRDGAALRLLGIERLPLRTLEQFWPNGGPVWDALGVSSSGKLLLVEAKAHIAEAASPGSRASTDSLEHIERSLAEARYHYSPRATARWSGPLYQYGNRLAFQYLLKILNGLESRLVFLNFCNAPDVKSPESRAEWRGATELIHALLGLPSDLSRHGVFHAYVDVRQVLEQQGKPDRVAGR